MRRRAVMSSAQTSRMVAWGWGWTVGAIVASVGGTGVTIWGGVVAGGTGSLAMAGERLWSFGADGGGAYFGCFWFRNERRDDWAVLAAVGKDMV